MTIRTFTNGNEEFGQTATGGSVFGDTFNHLAGNDRLILLRNDDTAGLGLSGVANMGDGHDFVFTSFNTSGTFNLGAGDDIFVSGGNFSLSTTDVIVNGGAGNDIFAATTTRAIYNGDIGNDVFVSDGSNNTFNAGDGLDTYSAEFAEGQTNIDLQAGTAFSRFAGAFDDLNSVENARGSSFRDIIFGSSGNNRIDGLGGNDDIDGDPGNDTISGGPGTNNLFGNLGTDTLVVSGTVNSKSGTAANFTVSGLVNGLAFTHVADSFEQVILNGVLMTSARFLNPVAANVTVNSTISERAVLGIINGTAAGKIVNGNSSANTLNGGAGFDDISGFGGNDTLHGNGGVDRILGGDGNDTIFGEDGSDILFGLNGNDTISGGNHNDTLFGMLGNDTLTGGAMNDIFIFNSALSAANADIVTDYNVSLDGIRIDSTILSGIADGLLVATRFKNTAQGAVDADDRIIYNSTNGNLLFDSNGSGANGQTLIADFAAGLAMVATEITIL